MNELDRLMLTKKLLQIALKKTGQAAPDEAAVRSLALKMLGVLTPVPLTADKADTQVFHKDITSLNNLLHFLVDNGVRYNGKKIAIPLVFPGSLEYGSGIGGEFAELSDADKALYGNPYVLGTEGGSVSYHVYRDGLIRYLQDLRLKGADTAGKKAIDDLIKEAQTSLKITVPEIAAAPIPVPKEEAKEEAKEPPRDVAGSEAPTISWAPGQPAQQMTPDQAQAFTAMTNTYPLSRESISFPAIENWATLFMNFMAISIQNSKKEVGAALQTDMATAAQIVQAAQAIIRGYGTTEQPLNDNAVNIYRRIKTYMMQTKGQTEQQAMLMPSQYLNAVSNMLTLLNEVLMAFNRRVGHSLPPDERTKLEQQVSDSGSSLASINQRAVTQWLSTLGLAQKQVESGR